MAGRCFLLIFLFNVLILQNFLAQDKERMYFQVDSLLLKPSSINLFKAANILEKELANDTINGHFWLMLARVSDLRGQSKKSVDCINKAIQLSPKNHEYYKEKATFLNNYSEIHAAIEAIDIAIGIQPNGEYYFWKGVFLQQINQFSEAKTAYNTAIDKQYSRVELFNNLAICLSEEGFYSAGLIAINKALAIDANSAYAYSARSKLNFFLLNIDESCEDRKKAMSLGHQNVIILPDSICDSNDQKAKILFASEVLYSNKVYSQSALGFTKLIELDSSSFNYFLNRGYCNFKLGKYTLAEHDYKEALKRQPNDNHSLDLLYDNLSLLYYEMSMYEESIIYSTKRIELNPNNHVPYIDRGLCYRHLKEFQLAQRDFNKSLAIKPDFFRAYGYRSFLHLELGNYENALKDARKSVEINPEYAYGYLVMGQAKIKLKQKDYCTDFKRAVELKFSEAEEALRQFCSE